MSFLAIPHAAMVQGDFRAVRLNGATSMQERVAAGIVFKP
jgi:hypothetical protein